jgi:hypothetical protein
VHATAAEEEEQEWKELQEEGLPRRGQYGQQDDHDRDPEIGDIMGDYFDDPKKAQSRVSTCFLSPSRPPSSMPCPSNVVAASLAG